MRNMILSLVIIVVTWLPSHLKAWEVTNTNGGTMVFSTDSFTKLPLVELQTERDKKGKHLSDHWKGFLFKDWLTQNGYAEYGEIVLESSDHYQVRLSKEDLDKQEALVALYQNDKQLEPKDIRLILPTMRDMYWIANISKITLQNKDLTIVPNIIYWAEPIVYAKKLQTDIPPFKEMKGYLFSDLLEPNVPFPDGDVLIMGNDGVKHLLDYRKFLRNAVLEKTETEGIWLKSADMPAGMWIKNLAYVQFNKIGILFKDAFKEKSLQELGDILSWKNAVAFIPSEKGAFPHEIRSWENKELELRMINLSNALITHYPSIQVRVK
jgi:hypothetical protein